MHQHEAEGVVALLHSRLGLKWDEHSGLLLHEGCLAGGLQGAPKEVSIAVLQRFQISAPSDRSTTQSVQPIVLLKGIGR